MKTEEGKVEGDKEGEGKGRGNNGRNGTVPG